MSGEDERTPGTPGDDTRDDDAKGVADASADSQAGGSDSDEASEQDWKAKFEHSERERTRLLSEKSSVEEDRRRVAEERARLHQPPTADPGQAQVMRELDEIRQDYEHLQALARSEDPRAVAIARTQLRTLAVQERDKRELLHAMQLTQVPAADQAEVDKLVRSGDVSSVAVARELIELRRKAGDKGKADENADLELGAKRALKDQAPQIVSRAVGAGEAKGRQVKQSEWAAKMRAFDTSDPEQWTQKEQMERDRKAGKYVVVPG